MTCAYWSIARCTYHDSYGVTASSLPTIPRLDATEPQLMQRLDRLRVG
jgi:hypothetical protein